MEGARFFAGIELGGTKSIAVLAQEGEIIDRLAIPTAAPRDTLPILADRLLGWDRERRLAGLGIASFGPLQLSPTAEIGSALRASLGEMLNTPKPGWSGAQILEMLAGGLSCPRRIDTDVNAAALAEYLWGAGKGLSSICYITIGTGVGGGLVINGQPVHGAMHPEIGHLRFRRARGDGFGGACPFHGDCIEGLICGPALIARMGTDPQNVPDTDPRWNGVASDIAELACAMLLTTSAQCVLIGGGVGIARPFLLDIASQIVIERLSGYLPFFTAETASRIIRLPVLGDQAGPLGAIALAQASSSR